MTSGTVSMGSSTLSTEGMALSATGPREGELPTVVRPSSLCARRVGLVGVEEEVRA